MEGVQLFVGRRGTHLEPWTFQTLAGFCNRENEKGRGWARDTQGLPLPLKRTGDGALSMAKLIPIPAGV